MEYMESRMQDQIEGALYNEQQALERIDRLEKAVKELREAAIYAEKTLQILWVSHHANRTDAAVEAIQIALKNTEGL